MFSMPIVNLLEQGRKLAATGKRVAVLWQSPDSLCFVARGREYRSEFHINPCDETMYMIEGEMRLHYRTSEGREEVATIQEGSMIYTPAGTPHSPRFPADALALISERKRREGEVDRFHWYCLACDNFLREETFVVGDYADDPVSKAYKRFFDNRQFRTCRNCGEIMPSPDKL
ncbi:MAG: cupin domain-containing protein [Deltaproteobacteria bacterium]|nr:cupin domain-containing protein [Deltaproteobacteria bacterium]